LLSFFLSFFLYFFLSFSNLDLYLRLLSMQLTSVRQTITVPSIAPNAESIHPSPNSQSMLQNPEVVMKEKGNLRNLRDGYCRSGKTYRE